MERRRPIAASVRPAIMPIPRSFRDSLKKIIPPLDGTLHKGQSGRVGVIGGAQEYVSVVPSHTISEYSERLAC